MAQVGSSLPSRPVSSRPPARIHGVRMSVPRIDSATLTGSRAATSPLRIAIVTPYSWTYPGGVNRHVEALAEALIDRGHELRVLAPWDPSDRLGRALHRAPPERRSRPDYLIGLGRTVGIGANGAVSNLSAFPDAVTKMRRELRAGRFDVVHVHEPPAPLLSWDACSFREAPGRGHLPRLLDEAGAQRDRQPARSAPQVQPAPGADRGLGGRRLDRATVVRRRIPRDPERR